jgi:hypothetical protein
MIARFGRRTFLAGVVAVTAVSATLAHHGWDWAVDEQSELTGAIQEIFLGNPHAVLNVMTPAGLWIVELAPPGRTRAAGFTEDSAKVGDEVTAIGHRSRDPNELRMKAVRLIVNGETYDVYPDLIQPEAQPDPVDEEAPENVEG